MSNMPPNDTADDRNEQPGSQQLASILASGKQPEAAGQPDNRPQSQPVEPQNAAGRNRTGVADSENVDPATSEVLEAILSNGAPPGTAGAGDTADPDADPRTSPSMRAGQAIGAMTTAVVGAQVAITGFTNRTLQANARLAEWNGEIAAAVGLAQARQIERDIIQGQGIGPEYARLDEANQEYRDMMTEVTVPLQSAGIELLAGLSELRNYLLSAVVPSLTAMAKAVDSLASLITGGTAATDRDLPAARAFLGDVSDGKFDGTGTTYMNPGNRPLMTPADRQRIFGP